MKVTRRDATKLVLAGASAAALPAAGLAASNRDLATRLESRLNAALQCEGRFKVAAFGQAKPQGRTQMAAVIELTWRPGFRRRRFDAFGDDDLASYAALENLALGEFGKIGCFG